VPSTLSTAQLADGTHLRQTPIPVENGSAQLIEHYHPAQLLRLTLGLRHPHMDEERQFLEDLQTKGSPDFHHFLSPEEWTERFGPSRQDEQAVVDWARSQGLTVTHRFPNRLLVDVEGSVSTIEKAFHITINLYQLGSKSFFSTDRDPEIPSHLSRIIQSVGGLNNLQVLRPAGRSKEPKLPVYAPGPGAANSAGASHNGDHANYVQQIKASERRRQGPGSNMTNGAYDSSRLTSSDTRRSRWAPRCLPRRRLPSPLRRLEASGSAIWQALPNSILST
jgi:kumamolisin